MTVDSSEQQIETLLKTAETIAVVGLSPKPDRASNMVARYLIAAGYQVNGVNPGQHEILGRPCYPDLASIPHPVDIVDIFRRVEKVAPIVEQAVLIGARAVWLQLGIVHLQAAQRARENRLIVVMDRCIKVEHARVLSPR